MEMACLAALHVSGISELDLFVVNEADIWLVFCCYTSSASAIQDEQGEELALAS